MSSRIIVPIKPKNFSSTCLSVSFSAFVTSFNHVFSSIPSLSTLNSVSFVPIFADDDLIDGTFFCGFVKSWMHQSLLHPSSRHRSDFKLSYGMTSGCNTLMHPRFDKTAKECTSSNHLSKKLEQMKTEFKVDKDGIEEKTWLKR